ncbi:MAG: hypothetical protein AAGI25_16890 [Bacteroidota bacterium]
MWAFTWFSDGVEWVANGGKAIEKENVEVVSTPAPPSDAHPLGCRPSQLKNRSQ